MLCRRCGMDSATTDTCEWCKKPMLAAGAAAERPAAAPSVAAPQLGDVVEAAPEYMPPTADDLIEIAPEQEDAPAEAPPPSIGGGLRPLGGDLPKPAVPVTAAKAPTHGLSAEATRTSVDVANYLGPDNSLFRPLTKAAEHGAGSGGMDPLGRVQIKGRSKEAVNNIPDNVRIMRSLRTGLMVAFPLAIAQFIVTHKVPDKLFVLPIPGGGQSFVSALVFGLASGVLIGFGLGALLVQFKKGPFVGLLLGLLLGNVALTAEGGSPYWGMATAAISGFMIGKIATVGYRKAVNV